MSSRNEEIEVRIVISESQSQFLKSWLEKFATFKEKISQEEYYLDNPNSTWFTVHKKGYKYALRYLRVRITEKGDFVCYKDWNTGKNKNEAGLFCKDIEYKVSCGREALKLFQAIGFTDNTQFYKSRTTYNYNDFEISIDSVKGLGTYFEFEIKNRKYDDQEKEYNRLISFIENDLQIVNYKIQNYGFIIMLWNPEFDFV